MNGTLVVVLVTTVLIALSAFFVAVEFALLAARRHRLEDAAPTSRSARAALRSSTELTLLLAGSQLGITACALALGAITKPAVHHAITPVLAGWGAPAWLADSGGFVLALVIVTFLHLVVGEMAPKSWAIAHPETSAILLALPMRGFMFVTRPLLRALNDAANWCLRRVGVEPTDHLVTGQNPDDLRHLVEHSANVGALDAAFSSHLTGALDLRSLTVADLTRADRPPTAVPLDATMADVRRISLATGHLRVLVGDKDDLRGVIHARDTLAHPDDRRVTGLYRPVLTLPASTPVYSALAQMRESRQHVAVLRHRGRYAGVVTLADLLGRIFPREGEESTRSVVAPGGGPG